MYDIPEMLDELHDIDKDETLTGKEKGKAKGGAIGDASGSIVGATGGAIAGGVLAAMATSALAGTAIGTAIPGIGNIAGLLIGAGIGAAGYYFGGKAGRAVGTAIGGAVADDDEDAAQSPEAVYTRSAASLAAARRRSGRRLPDTDMSAQTVNDLIVTPQGRFSTHPDDYIIAMQNPGLLFTAGLTAANNQYQTFQGTPGLIQNNTNTTSSAQTVNDLIVTPQGRFSTHPDDYIIAMKNPAALVNSETSFPHEMRNEIRTVERTPQAIPPVVVEGEIELHSELTIDDKGYRLRQSVGKNTTPYKFATGNAKNARLIQ
jgi:hypothetical protein